MVWEGWQRVWCANSSLLQAERFQPGEMLRSLCCNPADSPEEEAGEIEVEQGYSELTAALHGAEQPFPIPAASSCLQHLKESPWEPPHTQPAPAPSQAILACSLCSNKGAGVSPPTLLPHLAPGTLHPILAHPRPSWIRGAAGDAEPRATHFPEKMLYFQRQIRPNVPLPEAIKAPMTL